MSPLEELLAALGTDEGWRLATVEADLRPWAQKGTTFIVYFPDQPDKPWTAYSTLSPTACTSHATAKEAYEAAKQL